MVCALVTAAMAALQAAPAVAARVERVRLRALPTSVNQAVVVRPVATDTGETEMATGWPITWTSRLAVECYARVPQGAAPDLALDALIEAVYQRLMTDATLGGVAIVLVPQGISYEFEADGEGTAAAILQFSAQQRTTGSSLT